MVADGSGEVLDDAWRHLPASREATAGIGSFTRARVERVISITAGVALLGVGIQAFLVALGPFQEAAGWHRPLVALLFTLLAALIITCLIGRGTRTTAAVFAIAYAGTLVVWPFATADTAAGPPTELPWIWYLLNVATLAAALAFPLRLQIVYTVAIPLLFGLVRVIEGGMTADYWIGVGLDVSFALILGGMLVVLIWLFRSVAVNVDETRARAVESYAAAASADAAEQERVAVAALMHDSVLAALIAAERADTPRAESLAAGMAREALTRLANTEQDYGEGSDEPWVPDRIAAEIEKAAGDLGVDLHVAREEEGRPTPLPGRVARALALAATQAVANAVEHAGGVGLTVRVRAATRAVRIDVQDRGEGFAVDEVPDDRLGIRASIVARVAAVGGTVRVASDADGTQVRLQWRAPEA